MTNTNSKILFYLRRKDRHPFGAVAMEYKDGKICIAASMCHRNDPWNSQVAHQKTLGRLGSKKCCLEVGADVLDKDPAFALRDVLRKLGLNQKNHRLANADGNQKVFLRELQFLLDRNHSAA